MKLHPHLGLKNKDEIILNVNLLPVASFKEEMIWLSASCVTLGSLQIKNNEVGILQQGEHAVCQWEISSVP